MMRSSRGDGAAGGVARPAADFGELSRAEPLGQQPDVEPQMPRVSLLVLLVFRQQIKQERRHPSQV